MSEDKLRRKLIHEVMIMAYEQGIEEGRKQALAEIKRKPNDFSHNPEKNSYTAAEINSFKSKLP